MEGADVAGAPAADVFSLMPHTASIWRQGGVRAEAACRVLLRIVANVLEYPSELRFRRVRETGSSFSKVMGCAGAAGVLESCGFEKVEYHDGAYFVIKHVDVERLVAIRRELELGLQAFERLREARQGAAPTEGAPDAPDHPTAPEHDERHRTSHAYERQLLARKVIHRVNAAQEREHQRQRAGACRTKCALIALAVVLVAVGLGTLVHPTPLSTLIRDGEF
jgi:hypothetical protein